MQTFSNLRKGWWTAIALTIAVFGTLTLNAQRVEKPISKNQNPVVATPGKTQLHVSPFSRSAAKADFSKTVGKATYLTLEKQALAPVVSERPRNLSISVPGPDGKNLELVLEQSFPVLPTARVMTPQGQVTVNQAVHYRGKVASRTEKGGFAPVAMTISNDEVSAIISTEKHGNLVLGRVGSREKGADDSSYVLYREDDLLEKNSAVCLTKDDVDSPEATPAEAAKGSPAGKMVRVYVEADKELYDKYGSVNATVNYIYTLFNMTAMLYEAENIKTMISDVFVWTVSDPFSNGDAGQTLDDFGARLNALGGFNGDIAHLFSGYGGGIGGIAWLDAPCHGNLARRAALTYGLGNSVDNFPHYSRATKVVTHEMGHNLGSHHTQWCGWPGGALDDCWTTEGGCAVGPTPINGGTIMSYCDKVSTGVNFSHGFGYYPGNKVRSFVAGSACLSQANLNCSAAVDILPGVKVSGTTVGAANNVNYYAWPWWFESGGEKVYRLVTTEVGTITATLSNVSADVDVFILDACIEGNVLGYGNNVASTATVSKGEYYIVVDGYNGANGTFDLLVEASGYCHTIGNTDDEWIQQVIFGPTVITSGNNAGYADFSGTRINLLKGVPMPVSITPAFRSTVYAENYRIWLDRDNDKILGESGEEVLTAGPTTGSVLSTINIPHGSLFTGGVFGRMRVQMNYNAPFEPCNEIGFGEIEDYSFYLDDYCMSKGGNAEEWIKKVKIGTLSHVSGRDANGYGNFANSTGFIQKGKWQDFELEPGYLGANYAEAWRVFIDLNNDYDFDDAGEVLIDQAAAVGTRSGSFRITEPCTNGYKRLRVQMKYSLAGTACDDFNYGEVQDFTVYVDDYCESRGDAFSAYIGNVKLGTGIDNTTGIFQPGYNDFTNLVSDAPIGGEINFSVDPDYLLIWPGAFPPQAFSFFIDFNRDNDFDDNGEYVVATVASTTVLTGKIQIPENATPGLVRIRVIMNNAAAASSACHNGFSGETEDYSLNLMPFCGVPSKLYAVPQSLTSAIIGGQKQSGAIGYNYRFRIVGTAAWTNTSSNASPFKNITVLSGKNYEMQMQAKCADGSVSAWSPSITWNQTSALSVCAGTSLGPVRQITSNQAQPTWAFINGASAYRLQFRPLGGLVWTQIDVSTPFKTLTGLTPFSNYEWRVAVKCGATWTAFTSTKTFITLPTFALADGGDDRSSDFEEEILSAETVSELENLSSLNASPNPVDDVLNIGFESKINGQATLEMLSLTGQVLANQALEISEGENKATLETANLSSGLYIVRLKIDDEMKMVKVVKQ